MNIANIIDLKKGQSKLKELDRIFDSPEISEFAGNKEYYAKISRAFLKQLLSDIGSVFNNAPNAAEITNSKIQFNRGGPAVAGDPSLYLMTDRNIGLAVYISDSNRSSRQHILYRVISSMTDYTGGDNHWLPTNIAYTDIVEAIIGHFHWATLSAAAETGSY